MLSVYRTLLEVEIRHDYFLLAGAAATTYTKDYDISEYMEVTPSLQTAQLMRDHRMIFKSTNKGFVIYVQAELIDATPTYATLVDIDPAMSFSFYWSLRDNRFVNYTNQRLTEKRKSVYYFSNRTATFLNGFTYLNTPIHGFGTTYFGEAKYHLGDIVSRGTSTIEMISEDSSALAFAAADWQVINSAITNYVNPSDRLPWLSINYQHQRINTNPGELIRYNLLNSNAEPVDLGFVTGTGLLQNEYRAPLNSTDAINNTLDLSRLKPGKYSLQINESGTTTTDSFYLQNKAIEPALFAVSEFFVSLANPAFTFVTNNVASKRWIPNDPGKVFLIRFRNRLTKWAYFLQTDTDNAVHTSGPRGLSKTFSKYMASIPGRGNIIVPDPWVDPIYPQINNATNLLQNIFSHIFLS